MRTLDASTEEMLLRLWAWLTVHRKTKIILMVIALCTMCSFLNQQAALADDGSGTATFNLPLDHVTDSHGVPLSAYAELPLDYGNITHPARAARAAILGMLWALYVLANFVIIATVDFVLGLSWLEWLLSPFVFLAQSVHFAVLRLAIIPVALTLSAVAAAITWAKGHKATAFLEVLVALVLSAVAVSPLATPISYLDGDNGAISQSAEYGTEIGQEIITDKNADQAINTSPVSAAIIDVAVRTPAQTISFGKALNGKCGDEFDNAAREGKSSEDIRKAVNGCDEDAKAANETDSYSVLGYFFIFFVGFSGLWGIVLLLLFFIIKDSFLALLNAVNATWKAIFAVFPWGTRYGFYSSFSSMWLNVIMVGASIAVTAIYLWLYGKLVEASSGTAMIFMNFFVGVISLAMMVTLFKMKRAGKSLSQKLSETLSKFGKSRGPVQKQPSKLSNAVKGFTQTGATYLGSGGLKSMKQGLAGVGARRVIQTAGVAGTGGAGLVATAAASFIGNQVATMASGANNARNQAFKERAQQTPGAQRINGAYPMPTGPSAAAAKKPALNAPKSSSEIVRPESTSHDVEQVNNKSTSTPGNITAPHSSNPRPSNMKAGRYKDVRVDVHGKPHTIPNRPIEGEIVDIPESKLNSLKKLDAFDAKQSTATTRPRFSRS